MSKGHLHVKRELHLVLEGSQVDSGKTFNKSLSQDASLFAAIKSGVEAVVDDARQVCVFKECHLVHVLSLCFPCLFRGHAALSQVTEDVCEVRTYNFIKELAVMIGVKLLNEQVVVVFVRQFAIRHFYLLVAEYFHNRSQLSRLVGAWSMLGLGWG
jgi:hypothetical protein